MQAMRSRGPAWLALGAVGAGALLVAILVRTTAEPSTPRGSTAPSTPVGADGPAVFYEILDSEASRLIERRLDGHSLPRVVASRTDIAYGRGWSVDPLGTLAIAVTGADKDQLVEAISIASGAVLWSTRTPLAGIETAVWSVDGSHLALSTYGSDVAPRTVLLFDTATGGVGKVVVPDDLVLQGFDSGGSLIARQPIRAADDVLTGWIFLWIDPTTASVARVPAVPNVGPASDVGDDVHPGAGFGVDSVLAEPGPGTTIRLWTLGGGLPRPLATVASVDRLVIDPTGSGVAVSGNDGIRFIAFDGRAGELFTSDDPIADFAWSTAGDYLAVTTDRATPNLTIIERSTGRSVAIPQLSAVAQLLLVRVVGGVALPDQPLPPDEPRPTPTPGPSGEDVAGFPGLLAGWIERTPDRRVAHVQHLVPTDGGGMRLVAEMPAIELGPPPIPDDGGPEMRLLPRPGTNDVLVWLATSEQARGWIWDGAGDVRPIDLPADWPDNAFDVAWRPDGGALAASAGRAGLDGDFEGIFAVAEIGGRATTELAIPDSYDRLEGWWSPTELRVGHGVCTEGCPGTYAWSGRLRVSDARFRPLRPADRAHAPIDLFSYNGTTIRMQVANEDPLSDILINWPSGAGRQDGLEVIGFAADGRSILVREPSEAGTDVFLVRDVIGRAGGGRLRDPQPERVTSLAGRDLRIESGPIDGWLLVTDRVGTVRLVRTQDGRAWTVEPERSLVWLPPSG
jgi:WD40 repeat protein